jgi:ferredoxin/flavodoxin---NADP+ reductase
MTHLGTMARPLRAAVIGSGPAGLFVVEELLASGLNLRVGLFERDPQCGGLVRYGVAPDHPQTRRLLTLFERVLNHPTVTVHVNCEAGKTVPIDVFRRHWDAVIVATGAEADRPLHLPGETMPGCLPSIAVARWMNGHPAAIHAAPDVEQATAVIIGNGNVALDMARLLSHDAAYLRTTALAPSALDVLSRNRLETIHILGRRGPVQASFAAEELRAFADLDHVGIVVHSRDLKLNHETEQELAGDGADVEARNERLEIFRDLAHRAPSNGARKIVFHFYTAPLRVTGDTRARRLAVVRTRLDGPPGAQRALPTADTYEIEAGCIIASIGHRGTPMPGLPFDAAAGVIPTLHGRIVKDGTPLRGCYAAGWIRRGAHGLIGHNRRDAMEVTSAIINDLPGLRPCEQPTDTFS